MSSDFQLSRLEARRLLSGVSQYTTETFDQNGQSIDAVSGEAIVQFHVGKTQSIAKQRRLIREAIKPSLSSMYLKESLGNRGLYLVGFDSNRYTVPAALSHLDTLGRVVYAEANGVTTIAGDSAPNDAGYGFSYHLNNTGANGSIAGTPDADIDAPEAWNITTGSKSVVIAILDTGIDLTHPDLTGNVWNNPNEIAGDGIDNDYNGKIDDIHGWNFVAGNNNVSDDAGHGTVVAGVAGAVGNNGIGAVGVNWNVSLLSVRWRNVTASGGQTGTLANAINAVNYVVGLKQSGVNIRVANNSYGDVKSSALRDAYQRAIDNGVVLIASAGNESQNNDLTPRFPTNYDQMITVGATDAFDNLASFSNYGTSVELAAPGKDLYSTLMMQWGGYGRVNGTSFAAAGVSGVVALLASAKPTATYTELRDALLGGVDVIPGLAGTNATSGRLNAYKSLQILLGNAAPGAIPAVGKGTITGKVFADADGYGYLDAGETGIAGRTVYVDANNNSALDAGELTAVSGADGTYTLTRVAAGWQNVRVVDVEGTRINGPTTGTQAVYVDYGVTYTGKNFGVTSNALVAGNVKIDNDLSGSLSAGDAPAANWRVFVDANNDGLFNGSDRRVSADADGMFLFRTLAAGTYNIALELQTGFVATSPTSQLVTVANGQALNGLFFGVSAIVG